MKYYLVISLFFHGVEEIYTCNNPNTLGNEQLHILCDWEDADFIDYPDGRRKLRPKRKKDNMIKSYYRRKHLNAKQKSKG